MNNKALVSEKQFQPPTLREFKSAPPPPPDFFKMVKIYHAAYQMKALEKCYKNMTLKLLCDLDHQ